MFIRPLLVLVALLIAPRPGAAQPIPRSAFPFKVVQRTLPNGLTTHVVRYDSPGLVAFYSVVRTGSRNEVEPGKSGFAHFFEHMMFRGTERYSTAAYNAELKRMGADSNAFTSTDLTVYHILAGKEFLPKIVELEADRFQNLAYTKAEFQKEARAVLGEYNKSASNPLQKMYEGLHDAAFRTHTYKHTTIGFLKDIEQMPEQFEYSRLFFDRYYRPDNVSLLIVGDVDADAVFALVDKHYAQWKRGPAQPAVPKEPPQQKEARVAQVWNGATLPMLLFGYHAPAFSTTNVDVPALEVLSQLLFAERAPLYKRLVLDEQRVDSLSGGYERGVDPKLFTVYARVKSPKDLASVQGAIENEVARLARDGVDAKTLAEVVAHARYAFAGTLSTAENVALVGAEFIALTGGLTAIEDYFRLLGRVTSADVQRVARRYFVPTNRTVVTLTPRPAPKAPADKTGEAQ